MPVLIAEVDQTGNMEKELDEIVQHQQDQTQAVQTEGHTDAINVSYNGRRHTQISRRRHSLSVLCEGSHFKM